MGDVHIPKPPPNAVGAKVQDIIDSGHEFYATTLTGSSSGRVRRPTLFALAVIGVALGVLTIAGTILALIAIVLLAFTDNVVEL
jgi:hypothetical protein